MTIERGEVWWAETPESSKGRPFLVLTRNEAIPVLRTLLVAPISRTIRRIPTEVSADRAETVPSTFDAVLTVPKSMLVRRMGALAPERHAELCEAFAAAVDC